MIIVPKTKENPLGKLVFNRYSNVNLSRERAILTTSVLNEMQKLVKHRLKLHRMFGHDAYADDVILRFTGECTKPGDNLTYAAIHQGGRWWTTAVEPAPYGLHWERLVSDFLIFALPESIRLTPESGVSFPFFNKDDQKKLRFLQYGAED